MKNRIIVFGGNHHNTLGVLRSLGKKGLQPDLIIVDDGDINQCYVAKSCYIKFSVCLKNYQAGVDYIISNYSNNHNSYAIVICTSDGASSAVDLNRDRFDNTFIVPGAIEKGRITKLMNKQTMSLLARDIGISVPKTWMMVDNTIPNDIIFPCIVKPLLSIEGTKQDIKVFASLPEYADFIKNVDHPAKYQIQQFIKKDFEYQLIGCSLNSGERVIIPGYSHVIRPSDNSNTGFLKYLPLDNTIDLDKCVEFIKKTGYSGLFSMEFIRSLEGEDYFMEINFRNDGNAICVTAAGVNLPYIWYQYNSGINIEEESFVIKPVYVMPEFDDFMMVLQKRISFWRWIKDLKKTDCFMEYDENDLKPFFSRLFDFLKLVFKHIF